MTTSLDPHAEEALLEAARDVRQRAYAPYSRFPVGAALLTQSGQVYRGCNVENASYGLTVCAERVAAGTAVAAGDQAFVALALSISSGGTPCGACRQFLAEFNPDLFVLIENSDDGRIMRTNLTELLPARFDFEVPNDDE